MNRASAAILFLCSGAATPAWAQQPVAFMRPVARPVAVATTLADPVQVEAARRIVATLQLAAQEYRLAWRGDELVNAAEWDEARLFIAEARRAVPQLGGALSTEMAGRLAMLERRVASRMPAESLAIEARAIETRLTAALGTSLDERPAREPSLAEGARLYAASCASCHGAGGHGDGVAARGLTPPPADLTASETLASTTPLDYYRKITHGVPGTAMQPFASLTREERWDIVAHVFALADTAAQGGRGGQLAVVFGTVRGTLGGARALAAQGDAAAAAQKAFDAYMAFEAVEASLGATDPAIVTRTEQRFSAFRTAAATAQPAAVLEARHTELLAALAEAEHALTRGRSTAGLFIESLLLMLREGFEAILVVGAIMAVLLKAGAEHRRSTVRWGVAAALAASLLTAAALEFAFRATPAQREALEGGVMLVAAATLFYVSYWLVSKIEIAAWTRFVKGHIQKAVESGSALALGGVAFLAVYREGFETVLFYKALYVTGGAGGGAPITTGIIVGLVGLAVVYLGIERFGLKLPMRPFFAVTGATLAYMAFVFAGKGVKELQEGGMVPSTLVPGGPRNDFLGVFPTVESLAVQGLILAAILGALLWTFVVRPRRAATVPSAAAGTPPSMDRPVGRKSRGEQKTAKV